MTPDAPLFVSQRLAPAAQKRPRTPSWAESSAASPGWESATGACANTHPASSRQTTIMNRMAPAVPKAKHVGVVSQ